MARIVTVGATQGEYVVETNERANNAVYPFAVVEKASGEVAAFTVTLHTAGYIMQELNANGYVRLV